jgi:AcrR family transcriptional regulator
MGELTAGRVRPATSLGEGTRRALIEAALAEFSETSYIEARVSRITARAGVGYGTFYKYFASKTDLVRFVMKEVYDDISTHGFAEVRSQRPVVERAYLDTLATLRSYVRHREDLITREGVGGADTELAAYLASMQERDVVELASIYGNYSASPLVSDPYLISLVANSLGDEVARRWIRSDRFTGDPEQDEAVCQELARLIAIMTASVAPLMQEASHENVAQERPGSAAR